MGTVHVRLGMAYIAESQTNRHGHHKQSEKEQRGHTEAALRCFFDALVHSDLQNPCLRLQNVACKHTNDMRQAKQDRPGDKFPAGRPHISASSALLCPQAFPDWPVE